MRIHSLFSEDDLEAIRKATSAGESRTSGEIVPYIVERVVDRDTARWRGATLGALGAALVAGLVNAFGDFWGGFGVWWITLPTVVGVAGCPCVRLSSDTFFQRFPREGKSICCGKRKSKKKRPFKIFSV